MLVMAYCLRGHQGSNVLCLVFPQPRLKLQSFGPYVLVAPHTLTQGCVQEQRPVQYMQHSQLCSAGKFGNTVEDMRGEDLRTYVEQKQKLLKIPYWLCIDAQKSEIESVRTHAKDLLIAPYLAELKTLYTRDHEDLQRCISAMEDQNSVAIADRKTFESSFMTVNAVLEYTDTLRPSPIYRDFTIMTRGQKEANAIRMLRDLCMLPNQRPKVEAMSTYELDSLGERLLKMYPRVSFTSLMYARNLGRQPDAILETLVSAVHLPEESKQKIRDMSSEDKNTELKVLKRAYHSIRFESWTACKAGSEDWSAYKECTICLHTGGVLKGEETGLLYLTIGRYNPRTLLKKKRKGVPQQDPDVRFLLKAFIGNEHNVPQNATQFIELESGFQDRQYQKHVVLNVYDPATEDSNLKENSTCMSQYRIPCMYREKDESKINQAEILHNFLCNHATKIGQAVKRERLSAQSTEQLYRARSPVPQMRREAAGVVLDPKEFYPRDTDTTNDLQYSKEFLVPGKMIELKHKVSTIVREWQTFLAASQDKESQTCDEAKVVTITKSFKKLVNKTRKYVHNMPDLVGKQDCIDFMYAARDILHRLLEFQTDIKVEITKQQELFIENVNKMSTQWRDMEQQLLGGEYQFKDQFDFRRLEPIFFNLVDKTQTRVEALQDLKDLFEPDFFSSELSILLLEIKTTLRNTDKMRYSMHDPLEEIPATSWHWTDYFKAAKNMYKSILNLQTRCADLTKRLALMHRNTTGVLLRKELHGNDDAMRLIMNHIL